MKKTLAALVTALSISIGGCNIQPVPNYNSQQPRQRPVPAQSYVRDYENNNNSIAEGKLESLEHSVEMLRLDAEYCVVGANGQCDTTKKNEQVQWRGSGTVVHQDNQFMYILTAGHVALPEPEVQTLWGDKYKLVGEPKIIIEGKNIPLEFVSGLNNDSMDYAYLRTPKTSKLKVMDAKIGDSSKISIGDMVYVIGYPLTTGRSLSAGNISCIVQQTPASRGGKVTPEQFMFTSPISGGNSGGPIFTIKEGELYLIGIAVATYPAGQNLNIGVKINDILRYTNANVKP